MLSPEIETASTQEASKSNEKLEINKQYFDTESSLHSSKELRNIVIGGFVFSIIVTILLIIQISLGDDQIPARIAIITPEKQCSDIGASMVRKGGNSVDAFIASALCLAVVNPFSAGLGAGGFLVVRDHKHGKNVAINCFFKSGSNEAALNIYNSRPVDGFYGPESIAIPGEFKCLQYIYYKYSRFNWKTLATPAINLATNGFRVSKLFAENLQKLDTNMLNRNEYMKQLFTHDDGQLVKENDTLRNPLLANTFRLLINDENNLYDGQNLTIGLLENINGQFNKNDLAKYTVLTNQLVTANYKDFVLLTTTYPSNGPMLGFILNLTSNLNIQTNDFQSSLFYSKFLQAVRVAYLLQSNIADPNINQSYVSELQRKINDAIDLYSQSMLKNSTVNISSYKIDGFDQNDDLHTNYISVNDHHDIMVSYVGTLGSLWGSQIMTRHGYMLNNGYSLFSFANDQNPNMNNYVGINKQPRGLMTPIITFNKNNPCMRRFVVSYAHNHIHDHCLSSLSQVLLKLFTDLSFYPSAISDKRLEYEPNDNVCFEDGFDSNIENEISRYLQQTNMITSNTSCKSEAINLVMKKDPIVYAEIDKTRSISQDNFVLFNS